MKKWPNLDMSTIEPTATRAGVSPSYDAGTRSRSEVWLPTLLSVIAGMVDVIGFLSLNIFTAHVTGNIVLIGALIVRHNRVNLAQILADCQGMEETRYWLDATASLGSISADYLPVDFQHYYQTVR
jgi:hypothetical protein